MGLDIFLIEYQGKRDDGYLITKNVGEKYNWDTRRRTIRHEFSKNIDQIELWSGLYGDMQAFYRPKNFEKAYEWART